MDRTAALCHDGVMLEVGSLNKSFGSLQALRNLSFHVGRGEIFGFVGSNGAGKTTAMRIMLGVMAADSGTVTWNGRPLDMEVRRRIGYMPEERGLYPRMAAGAQLEYFARLHGVPKADATAAMERWTERLGVAGRRGDNVQKLSLGNQQRVQLGAALVHDPDLLVLDEPFSGLDPVAVDVMSGVLKEKASAGVPVVFSSHQLDLVERLCDRVGIVSQGSVVAEGTIEELRGSADPQLALAVTAPADALERARDAGLSIFTSEQIIRSLPGYSAQILTFSLMIGSLVLIASTVLGIFIYVLTLQKRPVIGILKARGVPTSYLAGSGCAQTLVLSGAGIAIGSLLALGTSLILPAAVPFRSSGPLYALIAIAFVTVSVAGGLISVRAVARIDPVEAIA